MKTKAKKFMTQNRATLLSQLPNMLIAILLGLMVWWMQTTVTQSNREMRQEFRETRSELRESVRRVSDNLQANYVTRREFDAWRAYDKAN
jgi:hypothetical protein